MLAIYCRTSNSKSGKVDYSIGNQQDGGLKLANQLGIDYKIYIDEGISGTIRERESFMEMIEHIQGKDKNVRISGVYCIDQSRIERDSDIWRFFSAECIINKVKFYPNGIELDLNDITNKLFADLISLVNEYYASLTSRKVKLANAKKTSKGKTHGQIAYGYGRDKENNFIIINKEAEIVKKIFQWKIDGLGNYLISNKLNEENIPTKQNKKWRGVTIDGIIKNKLYMGIREWNKEDIDNYIEFKLDNYIIEPELWEKANKTYRENKNKAGKKQHFKYLLDDILFCGKCGQRFFGKKRLKGADSAYKCRGMVKFANHECRENRGVNIEKIDTFIIKHLFESKTLKELLTNAPKNEGELAVLKEKLETLNKKKDLELKNKNKLYSLLLNPDLENDVQIINDYTKSKKKLEATLVEINGLTLKIGEISNTQRNQRAKTLLESYTSDIDFETLKKSVNSLIDRIDILYDRNPKSHGGNFVFRIKYKNYEEYSTFIAKSTLFEFSWMNYYRSLAISEFDLNEDRENEKYFLSKVGINNEQEFISGLIAANIPLNNDTNPWSNEFKGTESIISKNEKISFSKEDLINLN